MKKLRWGVVLSTMILVMYGRSASAAATVDERKDWLSLAAQLLSDRGLYLPRISWGASAGSPADGLVVAEPVAATYYRLALLDDPSIAQRSERDIWRLNSLLAAWDAAVQSPAFGSALEEVSARVHGLVAGGQDPDEAVDWILEAYPSLADTLQIQETSRSSRPSRERASGTSNTEEGTLRCFDTEYHVKTRMPAVCEQGGSGCWVEVPCPTPKK